MIHRYCGILSAYGLGLADIVQEKEIPFSYKDLESAVKDASQKFDELCNENSKSLKEEGLEESQIENCKNN